MITRIARAGMAALLLALGMSGPVAALEAEYDGVYGLIATTYGRGGFIVDFIDEDEVRVTTGLTGLLASTEYRLVLSKAACGNRNTPAKEVLRATFMTNGVGAAFRAEVVPWLWSAMAPVPRSARIRPVEGGQGVCVAASAFGRLQHSAGADPPAEMEYARFWDGARRGLVFLDRLDGTTGRLSWSFTGLTPGATYRLVGATVGCGRRVNQQNRLYSVTVGPDIHGNSASNQDITVENDETHWVGSNRLRRVGGGQWGCRKASVTDLVLDPFNPT